MAAHVTTSCRHAITWTMVPPVAIMGSDTSTLSSGANVAGSLFRYHDACRWVVMECHPLPLQPVWRNAPLSRAGPDMDPDASSYNVV
jgi:hypothetical protein